MKQNLSKNRFLSGKEQVDSLCMCVFVICGQGFAGIFFFNIKFTFLLFK